MRFFIRPPLALLYIITSVWPLPCRPVAAFPFAALLRCSSLRHLRWLWQFIISPPCCGPFASPRSPPWSVLFCSFPQASLSDSIGRVAFVVSFALPRLFVLPSRGCCLSLSPFPCCGRAFPVRLVCWVLFPRTLSLLVPLWFPRLLLCSRPVCSCAAIRLSRVLRDSAFGAPPLAGGFAGCVPFGPCVRLLVLLVRCFAWACRRLRGVPRVLVPWLWGAGYVGAVSLSSVLLCGSPRSSALCSLRRVLRSVLCFSRRGHAPLVRPSVGLVPLPVPLVRLACVSGVVTSPASFFFVLFQSFLVRLGLLLVSPSRVVFCPCCLLLVRGFLYLLLYPSHFWLPLWCSCSCLGTRFARFVSPACPWVGQFLCVFGDFFWSFGRLLYHQVFGCYFPYFPAH